jgi:hypothetical protein
MKNERGIPGIPQLQLQRKQRMVKRMATKLSGMPCPEILAKVAT